MSANYSAASSEDNELLKNSVKMKEAPFGRTESEDDLIDEYDTFTFKTRCMRKRSCLEKSQCVVLVVAVIIIICLIIALATRNSGKVGTVFCHSQDCVESTGSILSGLDASAHPCQDFYQFSCGRWVKETPIPPGYPLWNRFQELSYKNLHILQQFLESHTMEGSAQKKAKKFYSSCLKESRWKRLRTVLNFQELLRNISGNADTWELDDVLEKVNRYNAWPFFAVLVGPDEKRPDKNIIKLDYGESPIPAGVFTEINNDEDQSPHHSANPHPDNTLVNLTHKSDHLDSGYTVVNTTRLSTSTPVPTPKPKYKHVEYLQWNKTDVIQQYLEDTVRLLQVVWNKTQEDSLVLAEQILQLEKELAETRENRYHYHNKTGAYNKLKIADLQEKCQSINWSTYLNSLSLGNYGILDKTQQVVVLHEETLVKICKIIDSYKNNSTAKPILRYYMLITLVRSLKPYFDLSTFQKDLDPEDELNKEGEHWRRCIFYTNKALGFATGAIYVNGTAQKASVEKIKKLVLYVKRAFKEYLLWKFWMDASTREEASLKIHDMLEKISYPSYILDQKFLDDYYEKLNVETDWFRNAINWELFQVEQVMKSLGKTPDRRSWISPPVTVESEYSAVRNDIMFPIALFHLPFFSANAPAALNFGAMGAVIGHEITHAFNIQGRQYDGTGQLRDWWKPATAKNFKVTTACMKDQYDGYKVDGLQVNGEQTLDENIADNGGFRAAYIAYKLWQDENGDDLPLPALNLTNQQLFHVAYAQMYCSKWKPEGLLGELMGSTHCPGPIRVKGTLSNSEEFSRDFKCSNIADMNPNIKCRVW